MNNPILFLKSYLISLSSRRKYYFLTTALTLSGLLILGSAGLIYISNWLNIPYETNGTPRLVNIRKGASLDEISRILKKEGLIKDRLLFKIVGRFSYGSSMKAGEYILSPGMVPKKILDVLYSGKEYLYPVTIPEGLNVYDIANLLEKNGIANKKLFLDIAFSKEFISKFPFIKEESLEGYLFPSTYFFRKEERVDIIIGKMVDTFKKEIYDEMLSNAGKINLSLSEIITLASLIEKETALEQEKGLVSSVFYNRLKINMKLQCDPTVIYAIKNFDGNIRKKDLLIDSPYNTYMYQGLPPGPIANPGKKSVFAALHPENTQYLYFVATKTGDHYFSKTIEEHEKAVKKFQLGKK